MQATQRQIISHAAAAHDDDVAHLLLNDAEVFDELGEVARFGGDIDIVARPQREAAVRDVHDAAPFDHADQHAHARDLIQAVQRDVG